MLGVRMDDLNILNISYFSASVVDNFESSFRKPIAFSRITNSFNDPGRLPSANVTELYSKIVLSNLVSKIDSHILRITGLNFSIAEESNLEMCKHKHSCTKYPAFSNIL